MQFDWAIIIVILKLILIEGILSIDNMAIISARVTSVT